MNLAYSSVKLANGTYVTTGNVTMSDGIPVRAESHVSKKGLETTNIYRSNTTGGRGQIINHSDFQQSYKTKPAW
jgi:hypothetical protein